MTASERTADLVVVDARVGDERVDLVVRDGVITDLAPGAAQGVRTSRRIEADGGMLLPPFVEPHSHPDKAMSRAMISELGLPSVLHTRPEKMQRQRDLKAAFTRANVAARATRFFELAVAHGTGVVAGQADVDTVTGLTSFEGLMDAKERCAGLLDVRVTAFPQEGIVQDPGAADLVAAALAAGADRIGGWPNNERMYDDQLTHLDTVFALAERFGVGIDVNVDYFTDPTERMLVPLAERTIAHGMQGMVNANHVGALETYSDEDAARAVEAVAEAGIAITVCPTNLGGSRPHRGVSRALELLAAGVPVAIGTGNLQDNWEPFGNLDPMDMARLAWHALPLAGLPGEGIDAALALVGAHAAAAAGIAAPQVVRGGAADFVVLAATNPADALRNEPGPRWTVRRGQVVGERRTTLSWATPEGGLELMGGGR